MNPKIAERLSAIADEAAELRSALEALVDDDGDFDAESYDEKVARVAELSTEKASLEDRAAKLATVAALAEKPEVVIERGDGPGVTFMQRVEPSNVDALNGTRAEVRDAARAFLDKQHSRGAVPVSTETAEKIEDLIQRRDVHQSGYVQMDGHLIAQRLLVTETDDYKSAWVKGLTQTNPAYTPEEARAVNAVRGASLTDASGGYAVPVLIDPTIVFTTGAAGAPVLSVARIETITNDEWKGVTAAPPAWSFDAEAAAVSDDSFTLSQPTVTTFMGRAFLPFSIEIGMDYPSFAAEMSRALAEGYLQAVATNNITGGGTSEPWGIFAAIDASASRERIVTTSGALAPIDAYVAWAHLGEQYRGNATWISSVSVQNKFRQSGSSNSEFTVDLGAGGISSLLGRPYLLSDYAPSFSGTTGTVNLAVVGDFRNYVVAQRAGMNVELVQHLINSTSTIGMPTGQRGWFAWARYGADSINDAAFTLLKNAT